MGKLWTFSVTASVGSKSVEGDIDSNTEPDSIDDLTNFAEWWACEINLAAPTKFTMHFRCDGHMVGSVECVGTVQPCGICSQPCEVTNWAAKACEETP